MAKAVNPARASNIPSNGGTIDQPAPTPAPAGNRPTHKAKQAALDQKVWANDLPAMRKHAISSATSVISKKVKKGADAAKSSKESVSTEVNVPPRFVRKTNALLANDFGSSGEEDVPLSTARACPAPKAPTVASTKGTTHVEDFQVPHEDLVDSEEDLSDDNADPEEREQALAEQSESDDEMLASMEARGDADALSARLTAEQPMWSQPKALGRRAVSKDEKSDNEQAAGVSQSQPRRKGKLNHGGKKKAVGLSKTALRAQQECPIFKTPALHAAHVHVVTSNSALLAPVPPSPLPAPMPAPSTATHEDNPSDSDSDSDLEMVDGIQPSDYKIVFLAQGGPLSLKVQHPDIQDAIQATITHLERKLVFEDAFPDAHKCGRNVRMTMVETVQELEPKDKFRSLLTRLITDVLFLKSLASIPNQRISTFRGKLKDKSNISVASFFGLVSGQAKDRVQWLLPHLTYVYPVDLEKRQVSDSLPYRAPIVINVLRESFFKGHKSFYSRNEGLFVSSLPGCDKREVPLVMLALVSAAIHASLVDWESGTCTDPSHFSADRCLDAYTEHKILLSEIKKSAPVKYHTMMYKIFDEASGSPARVAQLGASAIAHLNLDAMEED